MHLCVINPRPSALSFLWCDVTYSGQTRASPSKPSVPPAARADETGRQP